MKRFLREGAASLALVVVLLSAALAQADNFSLTIQPKDTTVVVGSQVQFIAEMRDSIGAVMDTVITWRVVEGEIGVVNETGLFTATKEGEGYVVASVGLLADSAFVQVLEVEELTITLTPEDTTVYIGDQVSFSAVALDPSGTVIDTTFTWGIVGDPIGTIDQNGLFTATAAGMGYVKASIGRKEGMAFVLVLATIEDTTEINTITIRRVLPNGLILPDAIECKEGSVYVFGGFPFPLNLLNGGLLIIPPGALHEDITLTIKLPSFLQIRGDSVCFKDKIVSGATFEISLNDTTISPYYFDIPLRVSLPFKRGLIKALGLDIKDLGVFFYSETSGYDTTGISNVVVDSLHNRIFADVSHFSTLVVTSKDAVITGIRENDMHMILFNHMLHQNYPNPFNPLTCITYQISQPGYVSLRIFNLLGQEVRTLVDGRQKAGLYTVFWNGTDNQGVKVAPGIYLYKFQVGSFTQTRKMVMMK